MNFLRNLVLVALFAVAFSSSVFADCINTETCQRDYQAVQEFVNSKRTIPVAEKDCNLGIAGDIRFNYANIHEKVNGDNLRGSGGTARQNEVTGLITNGGTGIPFSNNAFDVEFNLYLDYKCDRAWGVAWVQYDNDAGIQRGLPCSLDPEGMKGSGCCSGLCLKKAYIGYNVFADGCSRFDVEIGRRPMYTLFDSRVQFRSRFDGVVMKYNRSLNCWGDFYIYLGGFVIDERVNHYGYITETGILNAYDVGIDARYSFIDWKSLMSHSKNRCGTRHPHGADFQVSQWTLAYNFVPEFIDEPVKIYGAVLWNSAAKSLQPTDQDNKAEKANLGWYLGVIMGQVCHEGDWSLDINYQYIQAQAIPGRDVSGIGRCANLLGDSLYQADGAQLDYANYKGWRLEGLYALTDDLSLDAFFEISRQVEKRFGGKHKYSRFQLEAIYAF